MTGTTGNVTPLRKMHPRDVVAHVVSYENSRML